MVRALPTSTSRARLAILALAAATFACRNNAATSEAEHDDGPRILEGGTERPKKLIFGITPTEPEEMIRREFEPLATYLGEKIGIPLELKISGSYAQLGDDISNYRVHLALLSPLAYVKAKDLNPGLILLATLIADGSSSYSGYIVTREGSSVSKVEDLRGGTFGFVDPYSTSGYLYATSYLIGLGLSPKSFFKKTVFAGDHQRLLELVQRGEVDAGATYSTALKSLESSAPGGERLKIIAKTGRIPYDAYCANPRLDQSIIETVRSTLLKLDTRTDEGRRVLSARAGINGFVAAGDDHYDDVRRVLELVERHVQREQTPSAP